MRKNRPLSLAPNGGAADSNAVNLLLVAIGDFKGSVELLEGCAGVGGRLNETFVGEHAAHGVLRSGGGSNLFHGLPCQSGLHGGLSLLLADGLRTLDGGHELWGLWLWLGFWCSNLDVAQLGCQCLDVVQLWLDLLHYGLKCLHLLVVLLAELAAVTIDLAVDIGGSLGGLSVVRSLDLLDGLPCETGLDGGGSVLLAERHGILDHGSSVVDGLCREHGGSTCRWHGDGESVGNAGSGEGGEDGH
mmetsp:Transcript_14236/g.39209  ORF Transcript_14236/g.39209 Transcript_14236/m.39209 type:complete len:245 (+) Transcript_14236:104-838(+)